MDRLPRIIAGLTLVLLSASAAAAQRQMEALNRGIVAINQGAGRVYVSWRLLGTDPEDLAFNVYRATGISSDVPAPTGPVRLNTTPLTTTTDFVDTGADPTRALFYYVRPVLNGAETSDGGVAVLPANAPVRQYLSIPLTPPAGGTTPDGVAYTYAANDASAADLDGDGEYELVLKWDPSNSKDNSQSGYTGNVFLDAYKLDGARLWRIDLGRNIRAGAHYTQFIAYDLDGDGFAEVACKTADGAIDGTGRVIGSATADYRNSSGYVLSGPEFLTIFSGRTGAALATTNYIPARNNDVTSSDVSAWGDNYGNRVDRFLAGVAYVDGHRPSLIMARGYYTRAVVVAWNWRDGQLTRAWTFDSDDGTPGNSAFRGQGNHSLSIADVDDDGRDEIIYGSCAIDDNGKALYVTGLGHGDALHVSDLDPERPGLEVWQCHEDWAHNGGVGLSLRDARTGTVLWTVANTTDTGRAVTIDIDPRYPGAGCWGAAGGLYSAKGTLISSRRPSEMNFAVWWDADPLREILDSNRISKWNWMDGTETRLLTADNCTSNNGTKSTPCLSADLFGDWREEVVWRSTDNKELRIYTTTIPATSRMYTLMHDPQYRVAIAWQNTAYNQPPHPSFYIGDGMRKPPTPLIRTTAAPAITSELANLSVRGPVGSGGDTLIVGFAATGSDRRAMLIRGVGPTLAGFGVTNAATDPALMLFAGTSVLGENDNWSSGTATDAIAAASVSVGAFALPRDSRDAALLPTLAGGAYTVHLTGTPSAPSVALVEVYPAGNVSQPRLTNISVRARVASGSVVEPLIAGFVLNGTVSRTVLVRAVGPQLSSFGVADALANPRVTLFRGTTKVAENDDWERDSGASAGAFTTLGAFALATGSKDAALLLNLAPGAYTVHASSATATGGVVLVEVYTTAE